MTHLREKQSVAQLLPVGFARIHIVLSLKNQYMIKMYLKINLTFSGNDTCKTFEKNLVVRSEWPSRFGINQTKRADWKLGGFTAVSRRKRRWQVDVGRGKEGYNSAISNIRL